MQSRTTIYKKILTQLDQKRMAAENNMKEKRAQIYACVPEIEEIDRRISIIGVEAAKKVAFNPESQAEVEKDLKEETERLLKRKNELMTENGFDKDVLEVKYQCEKCHDTGFTQGKMCSCFSQQIMDMAYNCSGAAVGSSEETFDKFDISYYSDKEENGEISPRENMQMIFNACVKFAAEIDQKPKSMLFYGSPGLGKTYLCSAIAKEAVKKGCTVMYVTAGQLFKEMEIEHFGKDEFDEPMHYMNDIMEADLLIIDDLGTEFSTSFTESEFFNIINLRLLEAKPVIISTNFMPQDIAQRYSDRVISRIMGEYRMLKFKGEDIRVLRRYGK